jgi:hypothetical protein
MNTLAVLTFHAKQPGLSPLALSGTLVSDSAGITRLANKIDGSVQVRRPAMRVDSTCTVSQVAGVPFTVPVLLDYAADMSAFEFTMNWNPAILQLQQVDLGGFLLSTGRTFGGIVQSGGPGTLTYGAYTVGATPAGPSGSGVLAILTFMPLAPGNTVLDLQASTVSNTVGDSFTTLRTDGCVQVVNPAAEVELVKTVGTVPGVCATTDEIMLPPGGGTAYYCYTITNNGNVALTEHDLVDSELGVILDALQYNLAAGASVNTVAAGLTVSATITQTTINTATWTASAPDLSTQLGQNVSAEDTDSAEAFVVAPEVELVKTVGTQPGVCATTDEITLTAAGTVYYCYTITNNGNVALTEHDLVDSELGAILDGFQYNLAAGASVNTVAAGLTVSATITQTTINTATLTASAPDLSALLGEDVRAEDTASAAVTEAATAVTLSGFVAGSKSSTGLPLAALMLALLAPAIAVGAKTVLDPPAHPLVLAPCSNEHSPPAGHPGRGRVSRVWPPCMGTFRWGAPSRLLVSSSRTPPSPSIAVHPSGATAQQGSYAGEHCNESLLILSLSR